MGNHYNIDDNSSVLFTAVFADRMRCTCADNGAGGNIMDRVTLENLKDAGKPLCIEQLNHPRLLDMMACTEHRESARLVCKAAVTLHTKGHIRHGSALVLRKFHWLIPDQKLAEPLLVRPILEALGLNTRNIIVANADILSGSVGSALLLDPIEEEPDGIVERVIEALFHADCGEYNIATDKNDGELCGIGT